MTFCQRPSRPMKLQNDLSLSISIQCYTMGPSVLLLDILSLSVIKKSTVVDDQSVVLFSVNTVFKYRVVSDLWPLN